jgi:ABC-type dipeptide/oligopeptide/nickel transport system permease component
MPGLGFQLISAINQDDYTVVQGVTLVIAVAVVVINFFMDFVFTIVDPRIARE